MGDSNSFNSLMAMVESHLSKTSLSGQNSDAQAGSSFSLPNICSIRNSNSESLLPPPASVLQLPRFEVRNSDVTEILAHQVKNMLIARENASNASKEKQKQTESIKQKDDNDDYVIDLSAAIIRPDSVLQTQEIKCPVLSNASSMESLLSGIEKDMEKLEEPTEKPLPICDDMSYLLYQRIRRAKCSPFGKVLTSRLRPVAAPYLRTKMMHPDVIPFDFSTPSPCDVNKEKRSHPPVDPYAHMNMVERFMAMTDEPYCQHLIV